PRLNWSGPVVGFGGCKCLVYRFEFAESFGYTGGDFARVRRSGHKCDASRHSCIEADPPAKAEDRIEHRAGRARQVRTRVERGGIGRRAATSEKSHSIRLVFNLRCRTTYCRSMNCPNWILLHTAGPAPGQQRTAVRIEIRLQEQLRECRMGLISATIIQTHLRIARQLDFAL